MHADMLARSWLAWQLTGSFTAVAGVNVARAVPMLIFGLFAGVLADRFDRRKVLLAIQTWTLLTHVAMAIIILGGWVEMWHVYGIAFLMGISMSMNQPVRTSLVPELVPKDKLLNAITLNSIAINGTRFIGPAAIAFIIGVTDVGVAYVLAASIYIGVIWTTTKIDIPVRNLAPATGGIGSQMMEGFRFIGQHRLIRTLVILGLGPLAIGVAHRALLPGLITEVLNADVELLGIIQSIGALGSLAAGLYIASLVRIPNRGYIMVGAAAIYGLALVAVAGVTVIWMIVPLIALGAMAQTVFRSANTATLLEHAPPHMRGRVVSVTLIDQGLSPVAGIGAGLLADRWGVDAGFMFLGVAIIAVVAIALMAYPKVVNA